MTRLEEIPTTAAAPATARPSDVVARIRSYRPARRSVLRGLVIAAAASALVPVDWYLARREAAAAPESVADADDRSEHLTCKPDEYTEETNNWWTGGSAVCYGGWRRGSYPCSGGFHREGSFAARDESYTSTRLTTNCHGRNAWRWRGFRCSDAVTTATFDDGTEYTAVTIAACAVDEGPLPGGVTDGGSDERDRSGGSDGGRDDSGRDDSGGDDDGGSTRRRDPARPLLPGLGSLGSVPVAGPVTVR